MMSLMVPDGAEGTVFALVNSLGTIGSSSAGAMSAILTSALGVTLTDFSSLATLTVITGLAKLLAIPFIPLCPASVHLAKADARTSRAGALLLASILVGGSCWSVGTAIFKVRHDCVASL